MEVEIQGIVRALHHVHLKDPARGLGEKRLFQPLEALGAALFHKIRTLRNAAARDRGRGEISWIEPSLLRLVGQEIEPESAVLQKLSDFDHKRVFDLCFIDDF